MLDECRRGLFRLCSVGDLQVEHLEKGGSWQVKSKRLSRCLDEAHHLAVFLRDVDESFLRQWEQRREC